MSKRSNLSYEKARLKDLLWRMIEVYYPNCYFCHKTFIRSEVLPSRGGDKLTEHHIDGNHYNNNTDNYSLCHRSCHKAHEQGKNINFWRQFR